MSGVPVAPSLPARRSPRRPGLLLAGVAIVAATAAGLSFLGSPATSGQQAAVAPVEPGRLAQTDLEDKSGVRVVRVAVAGGGGMIDVRYQVVDPEKALSVHSGTPAIVDERSGRTIDRQWMGHGGPSRFTLGRTYYLLFVNSDGLLQPGAGVTVKLGGGRVEHVLVR